jgi:hypothetical protein
VATLSDTSLLRDRARAARIACLVVCFAIVAGCAAPPAQTPAAPPAPAPVPPPPPPPPAPPAPRVTLTEEEVKQALEHVRNLLDFGQQEAAEGELAHVLESDPGNARGLTFHRQMHDDPVALYGKESFTYRVAPGDTLATIAQRFMNDRDQFYGLARYNGMTVPRQLQAGVAIKVPGKQRVAPAPIGPTPPPPPPSPSPPPTAPPPPPPPPPAQVDHSAQIEALKRAARAALARQDVCASITNWQKVQELDPEDADAPLELKKAQDLKRKLGHC